MKLHSLQFKAMGSVCEFKLYFPVGSNPNKAFALLQHEVLRFEKKYSRYDADSVTSQINGLAGTSEKCLVDQETATLLNYADLLFQQSEGLFDITSGVLRQAWNFKANNIPSDDQLQALLAKIGWQKIDWDGKHIHLPEKGMEIDFGGFVKEYAVDVCSTRCHELNIHHGLINLGGDVRIIGPHPDGQAWKVGIRHPREADKAIATIHLPAGAVATSGDYERYMLIDGKRYCHILNPITGQSIQPGFAGISVVAQQCLVAGSITTIAMLQEADPASWLKEHDLPWIAIDQNMQIHGTVDFYPAPQI